MSYLNQTGQSAYDVAVKNGFVGTEAQWLATLKGTTGSTGNTGSQGIQGLTGNQGIQGIAGTSANYAMLYAATAPKTVTNSASAVSAVGTGTGSLTLPANFWTVGKQIRIMAGGIYTTPVLLSNITVRVMLGATVVGSVTTSALASTGSNYGWKFDGIITCRSTGTAGTLVMDGHVNYGSLVSAALTRVFDDINNLAGTVTINTTTANLLDITLQWDAASTSRTITAISSTFEALN